ncbi:MAG: GTPase, partial [Flavobacteriales bacterium]
QLQFQLELELDFSEEDVEFASRSDLSQRIGQIEQQLQSLLQTYTMGRALKQGIPVAIVGKPNAGKSTLLNALLQEERALVSDIPGTTRDTVEDELVLEGVRFRFIDTAGIRDTEDHIE